MQNSKQDFMTKNPFLKKALLSAVGLALTTLATSTNTHAFTISSNTITAGWDTKELTFNVNEASCTGLGISAADLNEAIDAAVET